jgi:hydrogenase maturation protease
MSRTLVLGLGNDLLADDAVGIKAARRLNAELKGRADVCESSLSGIALMEILAGYDRAILIDAVQTGTAPPGTISELSPADLGQVIAPSPHYAGIPEMLALARRLEIAFPQELKIIAVEVADATTIGGAITPAVEAALPEIEKRVREHLAEWEVDGHHA